MSPLVAKSSEEATNNMVEELRGGESRFDPLMSLHWHFSNNALRCGGLYLMGANGDGSNDGHYCPICEFEKHYEDFDAEKEIGNIADQMREYAMQENLIPKVQ